MSIDSLVITGLSTLEGEWIHNYGAGPHWAFKCVWGVLTEYKAKQPYPGRFGRQASLCKLCRCGHYVTEEERLQVSVWRTKRGWAAHVEIVLVDQTVPLLGAIEAPGGGL